MPGKPYLSFITKPEGFKKSGESRKRAASEQSFYWYKTSLLPILPFIGKTGELMLKLDLPKSKYQTLANRISRFKKEKFLASKWHTYLGHEFFVWYEPSQSDTEIENAIRAKYPNLKLAADTLSRTKKKTSVIKEQYNEMLRELFKNADDIVFCSYSQIGKKLDITPYRANNLVHYGLKELILGVYRDGGIVTNLVRNPDSPFWYNAPTVSTPEVGNVPHSTPVPENQID